MAKEGSPEVVSISKKAVQPGALIESLAEYHSQNNRFQEALYFYHLVLQKHVYSKQDTNEIERIFYKITELNVKMKNYEEAIRCYITLIEFKQAEGKQDNKEIASLYQNIAILFHYEGKYKESLKYFLKSASCRDSESSLPNSLTKVHDKNKLVHKLQVNLEDSIKYHEKVLTILKNDSEDNINGSDDSSQKEVEKAEEALDKITKNYKAIECLCEIQGKMFLSKKEYDSALSCFRVCLETKMKRLGLFHREIVPTILTMGDIYIKQEKLIDALRYLKQTYRMIMKTSGKNDIGLIEVYAKMASIYKQHKKWKTSLKYYGKAIKIIKEWKKEIKDYKIKVEIYKEVGFVCLEMNDYEGCIKFLIKGLKIERDEVGFENSTNVNVYLKVASLYEIQGNYHKAFDYLTSAFILEKRFFGDNHLCTQATLFKLEKMKMNLHDVILSKI